jgi:transposase
MLSKGDKKYQIESKYNRNFSESFKREKVKDLVEKRISVADLVRLYGISRTSIYKWLYLYSNVEKGHKTVMQKESEQHKTQLLQSRVSELERIVGQKQLEIDYLNVCFEAASEELGYDVKKKYAVPRSKSSAYPREGGGQ